MATKKSATATENSEQATNDYTSVFSRFDAVEDISRPDIHGWYKAEKAMERKLPLVVTVLEYTEIPDSLKGEGETRPIIIGRLEAPMVAVLEGGEEVPLQPGQNVAIGLTYSLSVLSECVKNKCMAMITPKEKARLSKGRTLWKYEIKVIGEREPLADARVTSEDVPF